MKRQTYSSAKKQLRKLLGSELLVEHKVRQSYKFARDIFPDESLKKFIRYFGNDVPVILRFANLCEEIEEDPPLEFMLRGRPGQEDSPYWNKKDPNHARTVALVTRRARKRKK